MLETFVLLWNCRANLIYSVCVQPTPAIVCGERSGRLTTLYYHRNQITLTKRIVSYFLFPLSKFQLFAFSGLQLTLLRDLVTPMLLLCVADCAKQTTSKMQTEKSKLSDPTAEKSPPSATAKPKCTTNAKAGLDNPFTSKPESSGNKAHNSPTCKFQSHHCYNIRATPNSSISIVKTQIRHMNTKPFYQDISPYKPGLSPTRQLL